MADRSGETAVVRLRLIAEALPPRERDGRPTEFGLQDKKQALQPGREHADGTAQFDFEVQARRNPITGDARFSGPYVQGTAAEPFVYLSWKYAEDPPQWIRRQKIPLGEITWKQIEHSQRKGGVVQATVAPITVRCATVPVEWSNATG